MVYPYNTIMGWGSINKLEVAIHGLYLCMKIPGPGVITINGDQQVARNIERHFISSQRNVHWSQSKVKTPAVPSRSKRKEPTPSCKVTKGLKISLDSATPQSNSFDQRRSHKSIWRNTPVMLEPQQGCVRMVCPRPCWRQLHHHQTQSEHWPRNTPQEAEIVQIVRWKDRSSEGRSPPPAGGKIHQANWLPYLAC